MRQLYTETKRALRRGLENPVDREEQIRRTQSAALDILVRGGNDPDDVEQLWSQLGNCSAVCMRWAPPASSNTAKPWA